MREELVAGRVDVGHRQDQAVDRARLSGGDPLAEDDRARRAGRRQLHDPVAVAAGVVDVLAESQPLVEILGPIDVGDGNHHDLELHVHAVTSSRCDFEDGVDNQRRADRGPPPLNYESRQARVPRGLVGALHAPNITSPGGRVRTSAGKCACLQAGISTWKPRSSAPSATRRS